MLLVGDTGTSKTAIITNYLRGLPADKYVSDLICLIYSQCYIADYVSDILSIKYSADRHIIYTLTLKS